MIKLSIGKKYYFKGQKLRFVGFALHGRESRFEKEGTGNILVLPSNMLDCFGLKEAEQ